MTFDRRLDRLMHFFALNNSRLAREIRIDPSLVSRWRNGSRLPSPRSGHLESLSRYFSSLVSEDIDPVLRRHLSLEGGVTLTEALMDWLQEGIDHQMPAEHPHRPEDRFRLASHVVTNIGEMISSPFQVPAPPPDPLDIPNLPPGDPVDCHLYRGRAGKRAASLRLLSLTLASPSSRELFLTSEDDLLWMTEDPRFLPLWADLLRRVLEAGHRITIIHVVNRKMEEIISILRHWVPLHLTGKIRSFYYPKYSGRQIRNTTFILQGQAAVVSQMSTLWPEETEVTILYEDARATAAFEAIFRNRLTVCRPLLRVYQDEQTRQLYQDWLEAEKGTGTTFVLRSHLNSFYLPEDTVETLLNGQDPLTVQEQMQEFRQYRASFLKRLATGPVHEFVPVTLLSAILSQGSYRHSFGLYRQGQSLELSGLPLIHFLETHAAALEKYPNYRLYLTDAASSPLNLPGVRVHYKEHLACAFSHPGDSNQPPLGILLSEANILQTLDNFFQDLADRTPLARREKASVVNTLRTLGNRLRQARGLARD